MNPEVTFNDKGKVIQWLDGICDSTWELNKDDEKSVIGCVSHFMGVMVAQKSKKQPNVCLLSNEVESAVISALAKEALFVLQMLEDVVDVRWNFILT